MPPKSVPQISFLSKASRLLSESSPSTASHLGREIYELTRSREQLPQLQLRQTVCGGCGSLYVPDQTCTISRISKNVRSIKSKQHKGSTHTDGHGRKLLLYTCHVCSRKIAHPVPDPPRSRTQVKDPSFSQEEQRTSAKGTIGSAKTVVRASRTSRQRAKDRKSHSLQTLLKNSRQNMPSSGQLDLMDFMRP